MTLPWASESDRTELGKLLTEARVRGQIPLTVLGTAVGLSKHGVSRLLNQHCPKLSTALRLGRALGVRDCLVVEAWVRDRMAEEGLDLVVYVDPRVPRALKSP